MRDVIIVDREGCLIETQAPETIEEFFEMGLVESEEDLVMLAWHQWTCRAREVDNFEDFVYKYSGRKWKNRRPS